MNLQRVWWTLGVVLVALALVVCLVPLHEVPSPFEWNDKASHLVGHGALALYFAGLVPRRSLVEDFRLPAVVGCRRRIRAVLHALGPRGDPRDVLAEFRRRAALGLALGPPRAAHAGPSWPHGC